MSKRKQRQRARRKAVDRSERVKPSPLAEAKKRPWIMQTLLQRGPDNNGTTAEQHEAAIEIVSGFTALTRAVAMRGASPSLDIVGTTGSVFSDFNVHDLRLCSIYLQWATELLRRWHLRGPVVVEWITMDRALGCSHLPLLVRALDLWTKHRDEWRPPKLTAASGSVLTASPVAELRPAPSRPRHAATSTDAQDAVAQAALSA